jgi:hypothetical protein
MTTDAEWLRDFVAATRLNMADGFVRALASNVQRTGSMRDAVAWVRAWIPYGYDGGRHHRVMPLEECLQRGYGACADGAAVLAAVGVVAGVLSLRLCIEGNPSDASYSHVRMFAGDEPCEPWPERRWETPSCTGLWDLRALLA